MRVRLKWLLRGVAVLLLVAMLLAGSAFFVLNTETGTRWAFGQIAGRVPGELRVGAFEGTLWRGVRIIDLGFRDAGREVRAEGIRVQIDWSSVPLRRLEFDRLEFDAVAYRNLAPDSEAPLTLDFEPIALPVGIAQGRLDRLSIMGAGDEFDIRAIRFTGAVADGMAVSLDTIDVSLLGIQVATHAVDIDLEGEVAVNADLSWSRDAGDWSGQGAVEGNLASLGFEQAVSGPFPAGVLGTVHLLNRVEPAFEAQITWTEWVIADLVLESGEVAMRGTAGQYTAEFRSILHSSMLQGARVTGSGTGDLDSLSSFDVTVTGVAGELAASGSLAWLPDLRLQSRVRVAGLDPSLVHPELAGALAGQADLTFAGDGPVEVASAVLSGTLNGNAVAARGDLSVSPGRLNCVDCTPASWK